MYFQRLMKKSCTFRASKYPYFDSKDSRNSEFICSMTHPTPPPGMACAMESHYIAEADLELLDSLSPPDSASFVARVVVTHHLAWLDVES